MIKSETSKRQDLKEDNDEAGEQQHLITTFKFYPVFKCWEEASLSSRRLLFSEALPSL
jgi:capsid protein